MENELINFFGQIVKSSRDSGVDVLSYFSTQKPKNPSEDQKALLELMNYFNSEEGRELLRKGIKYCVELSLFKLVNTLEYGISDCSFDLIIKKGNQSTLLIDDEIDNNLTEEYWNWIE